MKKTIEQAVTQQTFNGKALYRSLLPKLENHPPVRSLISGARMTLDKGLFDPSVLALVRAAFLIELVKQPKIETTKFEVRWANRLPTSDPRYATFEKCLGVFMVAMRGLLRAGPGTLEEDMLRSFLLSDRLLPYEIPVDYCERRITDPLHVEDNIKWLWDDEAVQGAMRLRRAVRDPQIVGPESQVFQLVLNNKIRVKAYLTDRVLTGQYKTNREKRWEVHPTSVHFATRAACIAIERELVEELCYFDGFPADVRQSLLGIGVIGTRMVTQCPMTLEPLSYALISAEVRSPVAGKAAFQVGHKNPLKAVTDDPNVGHTAENIAWISEDGNRIQGSLSVSQVRALLVKIAQNYRKAEESGSI